MKLPRVSIPVLTDIFAFVPLALFGALPALVAGKALFHKMMDLIMLDDMTLWDQYAFPLATLAAAAVYALTLWTFYREKRSVLTEIQSSPTFLLFLFLLAWMGLSMSVNDLTEYFFGGLSFMHESFLLEVRYFLVFFALGVALRSQRLKLWLLRGLTAVSVFLVPCAFYLWKNLRGSALVYGENWRSTLSCIFFNINYYGYFLTVFVSLSAALFAGAKSRGWRVFYAAALILNTVTLCYNNTLGAWIGSLCGCLFVVVAYRLRDGKWNRWTLAALGLFLLSMLGAGIANGRLLSNFTGLSRDVGLILTDPDSEAAQRTGSGRWIIWRRSMELIGRYPLFGVGFEGVAAKDLFKMAVNSRPHNEFMQYTLFYGIPGGVLYALGCASVYVRAWRRRARLDNLTLAALTAAFGYLCGSFFGITVYNTAPYFFIMLGLAYVRGDKIP
ncbi:MAG: O-antigen ligase family protein [Oscillibacter sp.]|nr:O-antigen ligase family protein [Oscillibacter sp.]